MTAYPLLFKGVEWVCGADGTRQKNILRLYGGTKRAVRQAVTWVPENTVFCGGCLSRNVEWSTDRETWWFDPPPVAPY
jgi:hypothetical protein